MDVEVQNRFHEFLAEFLRKEIGLDVQQVTTYNKVECSSGYCDTCYRESTDIDINYIDSHENAAIYTFYGTMGEFFN
jgi:hypothetical protein